MKSVLVSFLLTLRTAARSRAELQLEVLALRHQLQVLQRTRPRRVRLAKTDRWLWVVLSRIWTGWRTAIVIVKPETVCLANIPRVAVRRRELQRPERSGVGSPSIWTT
jgi:putative transposase